MYLIILFTSLISVIFAQSNIDQKLNEYIKEFNLIPQTKPAPIRESIFKLGKALFHERRISGNNNIACMDCHHPRVMTHDALPLAIGEGAKGIQSEGQLRMQENGKVLARNTPALFNLHNINILFWDGRVEYDVETKTFKTPIALPKNISEVMTSALAAQAIFPLIDRAEMRGRLGSNPIADAIDVYVAWEMIVDKILKIPIYLELFESAFPGEKINIGHFGEALAEFQGKNFFFADTPYDRYLKGDVTALTDRQKIGMDVFFKKGNCGECHQGEHLSELDFDSIGVPQIGPGKNDGDDLGRYDWDKVEENRHAFRVSPLRNVALTAPYFHDGSFSSLEDVIDHYNDIEFSLKNYSLFRTPKNYVEEILSHDHHSDENRLAGLPEDLLVKLFLTAEEKEALVDFMRYGLTDLRLHKFIINH